MLKGFCVAIRPREKLKPWEWCEKHVIVDGTSSIGGGMRWRLDNSPWVKDLMEVFPDNRVETIVIRCATQSSKTQTLILLLCWVISEDPAPALWVANAKDDLKQTVRDRISPTFDRCKPVSEQKLSEGIMEFEFSTMTLYFAGGGSKGKVKSKPIRWLFMDEVEEIPAENVHQALERTKAQWNKRRVMLSTPDLSTGIMEQFFQAGDQRTLHIKCPGCGEFILIKFEQWKWTKNDTTKPGGRWNFDALAETIRWECPKCKHEVRDTPYERRKLSREAKFVAMNPNAPKHTVSFTWPSLIAPWVKWRDVVEKFLKARAAARAGDIQPLKSFVNDDLGEPWDDKLGVIEDFGYLEARKANYDYGEAWPEARRRFMAADRQEKGGENYRWLVMDYGPSGKSRVIAHGRANTKAELEQTRKDYNVPIKNAVLDTGYEAQDCYRFCASTGWRAFKGDDCEFFLVTRPHPKNPQKTITVRQPWRRTEAVVYNPDTKAKIGTISLWLFSNHSSNELLAEFLSGLVGEWTIPKNAAREFLKELAGDVRREHVDPKGRVYYLWHTVSANHWRDCARMILIAAIVSSTLTVAPKVSEGGGTVPPNMDGRNPNEGQEGQAQAALPPVHN